MSDVLQPDLCVIGAGAAGLSLAVRAASCGLSVALVEKGAFGGDRLANAIPAQVLLAASRRVATLRRAAHFGLETEGPRVDFRQLRDRVAEVSAALAPKYARARFEAMGGKAYPVAGRFLRRDVVEAGGAQIRARRFVVATGAAPEALPVPGLNLIRPVTPGSLCQLEELPRRLIILDAESEQLALAQALRRLGSEVVVLSATKLFPFEDAELIAPVRMAFAQEGVIVREGVTISRVEPRGDGLRVFVAGPEGKEIIEGSHLLSAGRRAPRVEGVGLDVAGVRYDATGIKVGAHLRTSNRDVHAVGAVVRGARPGQEAEHDAGIVLRAALGLPAGFRTGARVFLTDPEIAAVGLSEFEARKSCSHVGVLRWPFAETDRSQIEGEPAGHVKLVITPNGKILGASGVGAGAGELINACALAICRGVTASDFASSAVLYPSVSDSLRQAGAAFEARTTRNSVSRRVLRLLRLI